MSQNFLFSASFHRLLAKIDQELTEKTKQSGCPYCRGPLHQADYPRSPFGLLEQLRPDYLSRFSLCCGRCRKRTTPPSIRFFGRRWFPAPLLILVSALTCGINERRLSQIRRHFGITVSESTWKRWRRWWRHSFQTTTFWRQVTGRLPPITEIIQGPFPRILLDMFNGKLEEKFKLLLQFLSPLTGGKLRAV